MLKRLFKKKSLIFRLDDIAPNMKWEMMNKVENLFDRYQIKPIMGVIPKNEDKYLMSYPLCNFDFWEKIKNLKKRGWEIAMHGYEHLFNQDSKKKDYLGHGGGSEFVGRTYEDQFNKLSLGLEIFKKNKLDVQTFFAPNHTFDQNTIRACKDLGFKSISDGYGIAPYYENGIIFVPQLFYRLYTIPFGIQTIQLHLNFLTEKDYSNLEKFVEKNKEKTISYTEACKAVSDSLYDKNLRFLSKKILQLKRQII